MKYSAWKKIAAAAMTAVILTATAAAVTAASPIPSKTKAPDASTSIYSSQDGTSSPRASATTKSTASARASASSRAGTSASASARPSSSSSPEASSEPAEGSPQVSASPEAVMNVVTSQDQLDAKKYLSKGGAFGWFILTVLVSAMISFLISYRFYKMARKDNHLAAEIRALKKDIDNKMQGTIGGFSEYETKITNSNPGYARRKTNIKTAVEEETDDEKAQEIYKKWETQILSSKERESSEQRGGRYTAKRIEEDEEYSKGASVKDKVKGVFDDFFNK